MKISMNQDFKIKFVNIPRIIKNNSINFVDVAASKLDLPKKFEHTKNEDPLSGKKRKKRKYDGESIIKMINFVAVLIDILFIAFFTSFITEIFL
ncbi:hypothetical protein Avbf_13896 [Armadillidium vulgare]|nr:hypothetical protein Avbf_13896 [Armadillidium vulgare]